jgi:uncharacterized protein YdeI (YjbR/CyaY-like superfamily)
MLRHRSVDAYIDTAEHWQLELKALRRLLLSTGLSETVKWGGPCYTFNGKNVVGLTAFKAYFGLWFFQGALLKDAEQVLVNAQEGRTKAQRQWRMHAAKDIRPALIKRYVKEAIMHATIGRELKRERGKPIALPDELKAALTASRKAGKSFARLRPGLQREYADYVSAAKRGDTKQKRIEKILPMIASGTGLNHKYR